MGEYHEKNSTVVIFLCGRFIYILRYAWYCCSGAEGILSDKHVLESIYMLVCLKVICSLQVSKYDSK